MKVDRVNQVWSAGITYIRLIQGFIYLVAIIDWYSRYVLSWEVRALRVGRPEIFNKDQGAQFTGSAFTGRL